ncbi:MAG: amidase family protein, partial [Prosthecobacter sp.]
KDNIDVAGLPTTAACPAYAYQPTRDGTAVARLRAAGAIVIGKTNLDQFATGLVGVRSPYGIPRNAMRADLVPGGSSSGSAVAVARGIVPIALGTDTAGSGRVPAGLNNICGLKPSLGLVSTTGVVPACASLDCVSVFALTADDAFTALRAMAGRDDEDAYSRALPIGEFGGLPPSLRLGVPRPADRIHFGDKCAEASFSAALDMARCTTLITSMSHLCSERDLACWMSTLNRRLCGQMRAGRFIAISAMLVDTMTRRLRVCSAGLPAPKILGSTGWLDLEVPLNPPLGIADHLEYCEADLPLGLARQWFIYSDGILELTNAQKVCFEDAEFAASLTRSFQNKTPALQSLADDWRAFAIESSYQDDATALIVTDNAPSPPESLNFTCRVETLKQARDHIEAWSAHAGLDDTTTGLIVLACDELMGNLCKHAFCETQGAGPAACDVSLEAGALCIRIRHGGKGITNEDFERLTMPPGQGDRIGGLGNHVIRQVFDRVDFRVCPDGSTIELEKKIR